jgi:hypothetical protein
MTCDAMKESGETYGQLSDLNSLPSRECPHSSVPGQILHPESDVEKSGDYENRLNQVLGRSETQAGSSRRGVQHRPGIGRSNPWVTRDSNWSQREAAKFLSSIRTPTSMFLA